MLKTHSRNILVVVLTYLIFSFSVFGNTDHHIISWTNTKHLHSQLDLLTGKFQQEVNPGQWAEGKQVELIGVNLAEFPAEYNIHAHKVKSGFIFNVPGTGLVFSLDSKNKQFKRIDNTFFRGFNFLSFSFVKKDTLFSIGGTGFWNNNSILIYFNR
jgi:hypothetical protein